MPYQRSLQIEQRLETVLRLIRSGGHSTPKLAERLGVFDPESLPVRNRLAGERTRDQGREAVVGVAGCALGHETARPSPRMAFRR